MAPSIVGSDARSAHDYKLRADLVQTSETDNLGIHQDHLANAALKLAVIEGLLLTFDCIGARQRWEARRDAGSGMSFFIDHEEKKTYWEEELPAEGRAVLQAASTAKQQQHQQQQQPRNGGLMHASASAPDLAQTARCSASAA